jgi:hypothetical protein
MRAILTENTLTVWTGGRPLSLHKAKATPAQWELAINALRNNDVTTITDIIDVAGALQKYVSGEMRIENGVVYHKNSPIDTYATRKVVEFMNARLPFKPLLNFIERVMRNPSFRAVQDLYQFLEAGNMPITDDGHFLAYKKVRYAENGIDLVDIYTGTINNNVGALVEMPRNQVNEDPNVTCSYGLHVCSYDYLKHYGAGPGSAVVTVLVDPADVVAVPTDYNNAKMRVCRYTIVEICHTWEDGHGQNLGLSPIFERTDIPDYEIEEEEEEEEEINDSHDNQSIHGFRIGPFFVPFRF